MSVIDDYITECPEENRARLNEIRDIIRSAAPGASEKISWQMPTFFLNGNLVHFANNKNHTGFYPGASGVENFEDKLKEYKHSKGAIQFPHSKPLPRELIVEIVKLRLEENSELPKKKEKKAAEKN